MSFLDVLSCGLGAGVCLFLLFSAMPHVGEVGASQPKGRGETARPVGARFDEWTDYARYAYVRIEVILEGAVDEVEHEMGHFVGGTRSSSSDFTRYDAPDRVVWSLIEEEGVDPASVIDFELRLSDEVPLESLRSIVSASVGGAAGGLHELIIDDPAQWPEHGRGTLFSVQFLRANDWVSPTKKVP